jgi:hypothetical protein
MEIKNKLYGENYIDCVKTLLILSKVLIFK